MGVANVPLLPAQAEFLADETSKYNGFVGGWGSGKTRIACHKAIRLATVNAGIPGIITEPTYRQVKDVLIPTLREVLAEWGFLEASTWNKLDSTVTFPHDGATCTILMRNASDPQTLAGSNCAWAIVDEAALTGEDVFKQITARVRVRSARVRQICALGTPDMGKRGWFYDVFEGNPKGSTTLYRARTSDNIFLPDDYATENFAHLSDQERRRYDDGEFCDFFGRVYSQFSSDVHLQECTNPREGKQWMAVDFGFGCSAWVFGRTFGDTVHVTGEQILEQKDTIVGSQNAVRYMQARHRKWTGETVPGRVLAGSMPVYCDPAGSERYKGSASDVAILRSEGFCDIFHRRAHPRVADRVAAVQYKLKARELFIDPELAPRTAKAIANQAYDDKGAPEKGKVRDGAKAHDHMADALGYLIEYEYKLGRGVPDVQEWH